jgi:type IX secretion system PorP/SprF family membrane protein
MNKIIVIIISLLLTGIQTSAQFFAQQSLYTYNSLPINGAAVGKDNALSVTMSNRTMWRGIVGAPKTQYLNVHMPLKNENFAVGVQVMNDKIGVTHRTGFFGTGAYRFSLNNKGKVAFGLTAGIVSNRNMWSEVITTNIGDESFDIGNISFWMPNFGASVYYHDKKSFVGFSIPQLFTETYAGGGKYKAEHDMSNYSLHLLGGRTFDLKNNMYVRPSALLKYHARSGPQADLTAVAGHNNIGEIGITYRPNQAMVLLLQAKVNDQLRIAYGYDYVFGTLAKYERGTHEIALTYTFLYRSNAPNTHFF